MTDNSRLQNLSDEKLIDVVKNYRQYGYDDNLRTSAISLLETRGITKEQLELTGSYDNRAYDYARELYTAYTRNSRFAFVLYLIILINNVFIPVVSQTDTLSLILQIANALLVVGYFILLIRSFFNQDQFYRSLNQDYGTEGALMYFFLGLPFYFLMYFYFRSQMKEKMKEIK